MISSSYPAVDAGGVPNVDLPATVKFLFKETSSDILSLPLIETSAIVLTFVLNNVAPLTSKANEDEMSLLMATDLFLNVDVNDRF